MRRGTGRREIGAIDREMQNVEFKRLPQAVGGKIPRRVMSAGDARQQPRQHGEFAGQQRLQHPAFCLQQHRLQLRRHVADLPPNFVERLQAFAVDQHLRDDVQPFIARGALHARETMQLFVLAEDFLDHHIEWPAGIALRVTDQATQALEILRGIA